MMERWNEITKADKKQKTPGTGERNRIDQEEKEREEKSMEGRGKSRRRSPYRVWKRRGSALLAVLLTLSLMLGDISGLSRVVMAGQGTVREEFRIHRDDILKAAEEAIENGEPLSEPLAITREEEKTEEKYQEILPADGSVYEIFPDIEQVKEVDSLELRIFIRLAEGADPASYTLTGDETLVFLYVNGGDVTAEGRVNIDGYVSEFTKVAAFESEEEPMQPAGPGAAPGNGAAGSGNGSGNGAAGGGNAGNGTAAEESESSESGSMDPEDSAADLDGETEAESEEAGDGTSEDGMSPEETLPAETQEPSQEPESSAAEETEETEAAEQPSEQTPDDETPGDQTDGSEADGTASDDNTEEAGTGSADEDKETAGNTENSGAEDNGTDNESDANESDAADEASEADEGSAEDNSQADPADTENENAEADKEDGAEPEKSDTAENADSNAADEDNGTGSTVTLSLRNIQKVAASLASPSEAETPEADGSREAQEETEADEEDSYYEDNGDPVDEEDAAETEDEEDIFQKTHDLKGRKYDEAVLDETVAVRAFAAGMEDAGFNREDLLEGAHQLTYTVAEGEARLIYTPEYVRDEAVVTFGIIPAEGMEVYQVTANGEALAETEETAAIASASEAKRAKASSSDADYDEGRAVYYQIPQVLEDQTVEIQVVEEGYNDHPAFLQSRTVNGVTVTVSAEEGILPAGTELSVEEVTEQVADAVAEKVEAEAGEDSGSDAEELAESEQGEGLSITQVFAYDINLMLDGKKLNNDWGETDVVTVKFSGERIEEASKGAEKIEIATLETPTKTVEAALGGTEEMPVVDHLTADNIELNTEGRQAIEISGDEGVREIEAEVSHFTVYTITFIQVNNSVQVLFETPADGVIWDEETDFREIELESLNISNIPIEITSGTGGSSDRSPIEMVVSNILSSDTVRNQLKNYYFAFAYIKIEGTRYEVETIYYNNNAIRYKYMVDGESMNEPLVTANSEADNKLHFVFVPNDMAVVYFHAGYHGVNEEKAHFPTDEEIIEVHISGSNINPHIEDIPENPVLDGAEFNRWVYKDARFKTNTLVCAGAHIYALYKTADNPAYKINQEFKTDQDNAGQVNVSKDATWIDYEEGIGRIDLSVSGIPKSGTDVIIILDKSGSMSSRLSGQNFPERMVAARNAARAVRDAFLTEGSRNRVAYIPFSSGDSILEEEKPYVPRNHTESYVGFQTYDTENTHGYLEKAINATDAYGGTSYHDALLEAKELLASRGNDKNENAVVIFMSDGAPNNKYDYVEGETDKSRLKESLRNEPEQDPIVAADLLKEDSVVIYSVGIQIDNNQKAINAMKMVSSNYYDEIETADEYYYSVDDLSQLESVLMDIASELQLAGTEAILTDTLADQFELLDAEEIQELQSSGIAVDENGIVTEDKFSLNTGGENISISFTVGDITAVPQKYQIYIRINDKFLTPSEGQQLYNTNKSVELNYKDINEKNAIKTTQDFGDPRLDRYGTQISFRKNLVGSGSPDYSNVQFNLYRADAQGNFNSADDYLVQGVTFTQNAGLFTSSAPIGVSNDGTAVYYLKEVSSAPGYNILPDPIKLVLNVDPKGVYIKGGYPEAGDGMLGTVGSTLGLSMEMTGDASEQYVELVKNIWTINNYSAPKLPETGGPGFIMMERFGWMLLLMAMLGVEVQMLSNRKKRR